MHWEWRGMAVNFVLGKAINMENNVFAYGERKHPEMCAQTIHHPCVSLPHATGASWGVSLMFSCNSFIFHGWEIRFLVLHCGRDERFTIWRFVEFVFAHKHFLKLNFSPRVDFPIYHFIFGFQNIFHHT